MFLNFLFRFLFLLIQNSFLMLFNNFFPSYMSISQFFEFSDEKSIKCIIQMRINSTCSFHSLLKVLIFKFSKTRNSFLYTHFYQFNISIFHGKIYRNLIFLNGHTTSGISYIKIFTQYIRLFLYNL